MSRPWQIWSLYVAGMLAVVAALGWLTIKALELDRAEALARRQAELEEDISRALWRMDSVLTPLLAEEAARPQYVYRAVSPPPSVASIPPESGLSPLLAAPPHYVLLHFEVHPDGRVTSPQCPTGHDVGWALSYGASPELIRVATSRLETLKPSLSHAALLEQLPTQTLADDFSAANGAVPEALRDKSQGNQVISNPYENLNRWFAPSQTESAPGQPNAPATAGYAVQPEPQQQAVSEEAQRLSQLQAGQNEPQVDAAQQPYGLNVESGRLQRPQSRAGNDLANREAALQAYAQKSVAEQRSNYKTSARLPVQAIEGVSRPLWVGPHLLVARRVQIDGQSVIQGCWLNWDLLKERLQSEVADLLPQVDLAPIAGASQINLSRLLASVPVQLTVPPLAPPLAGWSPIRVSLVVAWACLLVSAIAAAGMLHSVMLLSERRGAFVSAVTHELRTPLTTFRMYSEMLAAGMVTDSAQRQSYLETLRIEADRLAHLVENVLQYARLERGRPGNRREEISAHALVDRCQSRLAERASQAAMKLDISLPGEDQGSTLLTDSAAVEQILFNLVDNACKYASHSADKRLHLSVRSDQRALRISVRDHGPGISAAGRKRLFQPFSKSVHEAANSAPGVGLGLALSRRLAADLGGRLDLESPQDGGAAFVLTLPR